MNVDPNRLNGFQYNTGGLDLSDVRFKVIVIHAGFGDATLIEATDNKSEHVNCIDSCYSLKHGLLLQLYNHKTRPACVLGTSSAHMALYTIACKYL